MNESGWRVLATYASGFSPFLGLISFLSLLLVSAGCDQNRHHVQARARLASTLRDSLGAAADPRTAFMFMIDRSRRDGHLYVHFDSTTFANLSDSAFGLRTREVARFTVRHYEKAETLDSVTVGSRENFTAKGEARMHKWRTFAIGELR